MAQQDTLMRSITACTLLGDSISLKMVDFLNQVQDQPVGFRDLGLNFLGICQILSALADSLHEHFKTNQPFPDRAIPELTRVIAKTTQDFAQLQTLLQKFMDFEKGGALAKLQKTWRLIFADKDIAKVRSSLQENKGALNMTMLLTNINPSGGIGRLGYENSLLAARLDQQYTPSGPSELGTSSSYSGSTATPPLPPAVPTMQPPQHEYENVPTHAMSQLSTADSEGLNPVSTIPQVVATSPVSATETGPSGKRIPITVDKSKLPFRTPKSTQGLTSAALKKTLFSAVEGKKTKIVEQLLDRGVPPDTGPDTNSVYVATYNRDTPTLKLLLEFGASPDAPDKDGSTPLRVACDCREEQARLLLEWGADPNISTPDWTALPWACYAKQEQTVGMLLQYGADPDLRSKNGETSLVYACNGTYGPSMVREMLDWGADPNKKNARNVTPLEGACNTNQPEVVKLLVDRGADPNLEGTDLLLKGHVARPKCLRVLLEAGADTTKYKGLMELATWENSIESVEALLAAGVDVNEKHKNRYSPLTTSIRDKRADIFDLLIQRGADVNAEGEELPLKMAVMSPQFIMPLLSAGADLNKCTGTMEWAAYHNNLEAIQTLCEAGVSLNEHGRSNNTALTTSLRDNRREIVDFLVQAGADVNLKGDYFPLEWAVHQPQYINQLLAAGADIRQCTGIVRDAVWNNKPDAVHLLTQAGASVNEPHKNGTTPLTIAIEHNRPEIFDLLMKAGADPNQKGDYLPLEWAVHQPHFLKPLLAAGADVSQCKGLVRSAVYLDKIESVRILHTECNADLNEAHPSGTTPILTALEGNRVDILAQLLAFGADPTREHNGAVPVLNAAEMAEPKCLNMLLEAGADPNQIRQRDGSNALMQAAYYGRMEAVTKLVERGAGLDVVDKAGLTAMDYAANRGHEEIVMLLLENMG